MNTAQWPQEIVVKPIDEIVTNTSFKPTPPPMTSTGSGGAAAAERKTRPEKEQALNCPRCNSTNTKFCYYNNYSLTQPRYFCKTCRRYWTEGGSLRNIPVGGGSRKNKRSSSSSSSNKHLFVSSSPNQQPPFLNSGLNPKIVNTHEAKGLNLGFTQEIGNAHEAKDLNLGFSQEIGNAHEAKDLNLGFTQEIGNAHEAKDLNLGFSQEIGNAHEVKDLNLAFPQGFGNGHNSVSEFLQMSSSSSSSALEHLGISASSSSSSSVSSCSTFMALPLPLPLTTAHDPSVYTATVSGFGVNYPQMQEFIRPAMGLSVDPQEDSGNATTSTSGKLLFPFKNLNSEIDHHNEGNAEEHEKDEQSGGFWTAMLSGASAASWQL